MAIAVRSRNSGGNFSTTSPATVNPATIEAGDYIVVVLVASASSTITWDAGAGLTEVYNSGGFGIAKKLAAGTEDGATYTHTFGTSRSYAYWTFAVSGAHGDMAVGTAATGTSANPDGPNVAPSWGSAEALCLALANIFGNDAKTITSVPAGYGTGGIQGGGSAGGGTMLAKAEKIATVSSENPDAFTISASSSWTAQTLMIRPAAASATLTDVDTDEAVSAGQANVIFTGTGLASIDGIKITAGSRSVTGGVDSAASTSVQADIPNDASIFAGNLPFGAVTFSVTTGGVDQATLAGTLHLSSAYVEHNVSDISQAADPECLYYGQSPAIAVGDLCVLDATTATNGWAVSIDTQGFVAIATGGSTLTDTFDYRFWDDTDDSWGAAGTWERSVTPTLSAAAGASSTSTTAALSVTTDVAEGTIWAVVTTSATTPSHAQIKAGQSHTGAAAVFAGSNSTVTASTQVVATGLTAGATYYAHFTQENAATTPLAAAPVSSSSWTQTGATADTLTGRRIRRLIRPRIPTGI
jgi:hypothetical protein